MIARLSVKGHPLGLKSFSLMASELSDQGWHISAEDGLNDQCGKKGFCQFLPHKTLKVFFHEFSDKKTMQRIQFFMYLY